MTEVQFRPLFVVSFQTSPQVVGEVPLGYFRRAGIISGGQFEGERLSGTVLPGGGDWLMRRADGVIHLDVRAMLQTDAGDTFFMTYTGRLKMPPDSEARLAAGEQIGEDEVYFRTAIQFEAAAEPILWLNDIVAFSIGKREPSGPTYRVFEML